MEDSFDVSRPYTMTSGKSMSEIEGNNMDLPTEKFKGFDMKRSGQVKKLVWKVDLVMPNTPETLMTEFSNKPDITMFCEQCQIYLDVRTLSYHRAYHEALELLWYHSPARPIDVPSLLQRRNQVLKKMKEESTREKPFRFQDVTKVDSAYELLKTDLEDLYEEMKMVEENIDVDVRGVALNCSPPCTYAIGMCSSQNSRWKSYMEDTKVYQDYFGEDRNKCYIGLFDGHHGCSSAERSANELHHILLHEMAKFDSKTKSTTARNFADSATARMDYELLRPETRDSFRVNIHQDSAEIVQNIMDMCYEKYDEMMKDQKQNNEEIKEKNKKKKRNPMTDKMQKALKKTYLLMDILLSYGKDERSKVRWSGTTALTIVIQNTKNTKGEETEDSNKLASLEEEVSSSEGNKYSAKGKKGPAPPEELGLIHLANAGNTHCILVRDNKPYRLTKDHTPKNPKERERVIKCGGNLTTSERDCKVNGVLSVTRGLGNHGDKKLKDCVIVDPYVTTVPIDQYAQFLVIATKGIWDVFSDQEVTYLLAKMLPTQQIPPPKVLSETVLHLFHPENEDNKQQEKTGSDSNTEKSQAGSDHQSLSHTGRKDKQQKKTTIQESTNQAPNVLPLQDESNEKGTTNILADLHTEIGSRLSEAGDEVSLHQGSQEGEDYLSVPVHSKLDNSKPLTQDEKRRNLAKSMAEHLIQAALLAGSKDNISVIVLLLAGSGV